MDKEITHSAARQNGGSESISISALRDELHAAEGIIANSILKFDREEGSLRKLLGVVEQLSATHDVDAVLKLAASQIIEIFQAERVFVVDVLHRDHLRFRFATSFDSAEVTNPEREISFAVIREVAERRVPLLVADASRDARFANVSSVKNLQLHSVMAAPLLAKGVLKGVVYADNRRLVGAFDQRSLDLMGLLANHIGVAMDNAELFTALSAARSELATTERLRAIGELAAFVAHELKNPLSSIYMSVGILRERWQEEKVRASFFDIVPHEIERLTRTLNEILGYARPTALEMAPIQLKQLLKSALEVLQPKLSEQNVNVLTKIDDVPPVFADSEKLREVFMNLIVNAIEAMEDSRVRQLRLIVQGADTNKVRVVIEDTGPGIPEEQLATIFEPFKTGKKTGTGLGLAYCLKIVREHGGRISAENQAKGGARFTITLPSYGT